MCGCVNVDVGVCVDVIGSESVSDGVCVLLCMSTLFTVVLCPCSTIQGERPSCSSAEGVGPLSGQYRWAGLGECVL